MLDFILNPVAGGKHGKKMAKTVSLIEARLKERKIEYRFHFTQYRRHAISLTEEVIKGGATDIIAVGGDGTLHEVINGFADFDRVNLGLIPCGTGNDFADSCKLSLDPVKALDFILDNPPKYTDYMQMPTVRGINIIGMGLDVEVLERYERLKKKTKFGYTRCLINALATFKCVSFDAMLDNKESVHYKSFIACIANGKKYGGGNNICPVADIGDNKLDFLIVHEMKKRFLPNALLKLKTNKVMKLKQTEHSLCENVKILADVPYIVNVDGELYKNIPFEIQIVKNTLKMYR